MLLERRGEGPAITFGHSKGEGLPPPGFAGGECFPTLPWGACSLGFAGESASLGFAGGDKLAFRNQGVTSGAFLWHNRGRN